MVPDNKDTHACMSFHKHTNSHNKITNAKHRLVDADRHTHTLEKRKGRMR